MIEFLREIAPHLKEFIAAIVLPFIVTYLTKVHWRTEYKLALSFGVSLLAALVTAFADGTLDGASIGQSFVLIFTGAQAVYTVFFKALGFEKFLVPEIAVVDKATGLVRNELSDLTRESAQRILDSNYPDNIQITVDRDNRTP